MALILLELLPERGGATLVDGVKSMIVEADSAGEARELASAQDSADTPWADATATTIAAGVASDYEGFTYRVRIEGGAAQTVLVDVSEIGAASDAVDDIGDALVIALNATADIAAAAYATPTLTCAAISDDIGDATLVIDVTPPGASSPIAQMVGVIVDQGIAAAVLTVVLEDPTAIPAVLRKL